MHLRPRSRSTGSSTLLRSPWGRLSGAVALAFLLATTGLPSVPFVPLAEKALDRAEASVGGWAMFEVDTLAGDGTNATVDAQGEDASFRDPQGITVSGGYAYVGTLGAIRQIDLSTRDVTTLTGHQTELGCTDHTDPSQVRLNTIRHVDVEGNWLYSIGTCGTSTRVRKTSLQSGQQGATSTLTTWSGAGHSLAVGPDGYVYATGNSTIWRIDPTSGVRTTFSTPGGSTRALAADDTYLWLAWTPNGQSAVALERYEMDGDHVTIPLDGPIASLTLESAGDYLFGMTNWQLRRISKQDGSVEVVAGNGTSYWGTVSSDLIDGVGPQAWFGTMYDLAWDGTGLLIADGAIHYRVRRAAETEPLGLSQSPLATEELGFTVGTVRHGAGDGQNQNEDGDGSEGGTASFAEPSGIVVHEGVAYVGTTGAIRKVDLVTREVQTLAGSATATGCDGSPDPSQARFNTITDLATDGHFIYATSHCGTQHRLSRTSIQTGATSDVYFGSYNIGYLTVGPDGMLYTSGHSMIERVDPVSGVMDTSWVNLAEHGGGHGWAITSDDEHLWVVATSSPTRIYRIRVSDKTVETFHWSGPTDIERLGITAIESAGRYLYALSSVGSHAIRVYDKQTGDVILTIAGWTQSGHVNAQGTDARFNGIYGIASDGENLWVADRYNYRIRKIGEGIPIGETMGECQLGTGTSPMITEGDWSDWMETWCADQADPVNSATGNFHTRVRDAHLPGIGMPFRFTRWYNSLSDRSASLGRGWSHSYDYGATQDSSGNVAIRLASGRVLVFYKQPDGTYWGGPSMKATLVAEGGGWRATTKSQKEFRFGSGGNLLWIRDRNGNQISFSYDGSGNLQQITDTAGRIITLTHNASNRITKVSLPQGREVSYAYTGGLLTSVTDLRGKTWTYDYGGADRLTRITDPKGNHVIRNTYGTGGRVESQIDPLGNVSTFAWDAAAETSVMTDARGKDWTDVYDGGKLVRRIDPLGKTTRYRYAGRRLRSITDPRGNKTRFDHDGRGNLTERIAPAPLSYVETWTYNARNDVTSYTDGRGKTTAFTHDASGNLTRVTAPGNVETIFTRDPAGTGLLTAVTDPRGKTATFAYDADGNLEQITSRTGSVVTMDYDASGRLTSVVDSRGNEQGATPADYQSTFSYDGSGRLLTATDPLGNTTTLTYDDAGNMSTRTDAEGRTTSYGYNAASELTSVTAPDATVTSYAYDASGNLIARTDANTHVTTYGYDGANRLVSVTDPVGSVWTYAYDAAGNLRTVTDANGNATPASGDGVTTYSYDELNRLIGIDFSDATPDAEYSYDAAGNLVEMTDGAGTETYTWDDLGRLIQVARGTSAFSYLWDDAGNLTRRTYPDGTVVNLAYDDDSRLSSVTQGSQATSYGYDAAGNVTLVGFPNGTSEERDYDRTGRPIEIRHKRGQTLLSTFGYSYDGVGNPLQIVRPSGTTTYEYDPLDRLTEACRSADCELQGADVVRFTYDAVGNRLTEERPAGSATYTYDDADRLLSRSGSLGSVTYSHDANGNMTQAGSRTFSWNQQGFLASTTEGGGTATYAYDGLGKRLSATSGTQATGYLWDVTSPLPELVRESEGSGGLIRRYVYGQDLISMTDGAGMFHYQHDALGSAVGLTEASGDVAAAYDYEPFGGEISSPTGPENPMRFTGEYLDETGFYHLRARQYDPWIGRFLSTDPLSPLMSDPYVSAFVYSGNRPTVMVDPSGLRYEMSMVDDLLANPVAAWQMGAWGPARRCAPGVFCHEDVLWPWTLPAECMTLWHRIFCKGPISEDVLKHELVHVNQFERDRWFWAKYIWEWIKHGRGCKNSYEREAYEKNRPCPR